MRDVALRELIDIVVADVPEPEKRLEKVFDWETSRNLEVAKWVLGASAAVFAAVLVAYLKGEITKPSWHLPAGLLASVLTATYGLYRLRQMRAAHRQFIASMTLLSELLRIAPFLKKYRGQ
jgi:hypothetical protein